MLSSEVLIRSAKSPDFAEVGRLQTPFLVRDKM